MVVVLVVVLVVVAVLVLEMVIVMVVVLVVLEMSPTPAARCLRSAATPTGQCP